MAFYGDETYARLRAIKAQVDPDDLFRGTHEIAGDGELALQSSLLRQHRRRRRPPLRGDGAAPRRGSAPSEPRPASERTSSSS